jgi:hypothetical protein
MPFSYCTKKGELENLPKKTAYGKPDEIDAARQENKANPPFTKQ